MSNKNNTRYIQATGWGNMYYKDNFNMLVKMKTKVDPGDLFRHYVAGAIGVVAINLLWVWFGKSLKLESNDLVVVFFKVI